VRLVSANASSAPEIDSAFAGFAERHIDALLVAGAAFFISRHAQVVALAARHAWPAIYENREYVRAGGLMSYSGSITDGYRQAGVYVGRILRGAAPADLPVVLGSRLEFVINLRTARMLSLSIPPTLLARADEVIE
jgi:putative ABC transport system substrate-binding protein